MRSGLFAALGMILSLGITCLMIYQQKLPSPVRSLDPPLGPSTPTPSPSVIPTDSIVDQNGLSKVSVLMDTSEGKIRFKFYSLDAPKTTQRITDLIQSGFYNGLTFHQLKEGAFIQGGDPLGNGAGGTGTSIEDEFNHRKHILGTLAMARKAAPNSADSQFYIALDSLTQLDHQATVFGQVIDGLDVVKRLKKGDKIFSMVIESP